jgi:ketosteroid isomerase-like protein
VPSAASHTALINRFYTAFARRDHQTMAGCYRTDAEFSDPVFQNLRGAEVPGMWRMLCDRGADLRIEFRDVTEQGPRGWAHWEAWYRQARRSLEKFLQR